MALQSVETPSNATCFEDEHAPGRWVWLICWVYIAGAFLFIPLYQFCGGHNLLLAYPLLYFVLVPTGLDGLFGRNRANPPEAQIAALKSDRFYDRIAYAIIPLHYFLFLAGVWFVAMVAPPWWGAGLLALGLGLLNGNAINIGHELGHRADRQNRTIAKLALGLSGYGHFTIEHNRGHHVHVATPEDCASARFGEALYGFAGRELPGALIGGWRHEIARLKRKGLPVWSWQNNILQVYTLTIALSLLIVAMAGWKVLPFILVHHFVSWFALTMVNYIEHYGLLRQKDENGRYEPCAPRHSWNANQRISNYLLLNLQRHSDHHAHPARPYPALRDYDEVPNLPMGYPGAIALAAMPPLWFRVMNPKVRDWANGDLGRVNRGPGLTRHPH